MKARAHTSHKYFWRAPEALRGRTALLTAADHPTGLGAARALHYAGAKVSGLAHHVDAPSCRSKAWDSVLGAPAGGREANWVNAITDFARTLPAPPYLLPIQDTLVAKVSRHRDALAPYVRFKYPSDEIVQTFLEKTRFFCWASARGFPLPDTTVAHCESDLQAALQEMQYPLVLKPLVRTEAWNRASPVDKAYRLEHPRDVHKISFSLFDVASSYVLSQWIDGPDSAVHFCLAYCSSAGVVSASYTGRKLLQYPRQTGSTAICVGTDNHELRELTNELFRQANFIGLGSLEVKYGANGHPYITEPTVGRPNLQSYSGVAAGINLQAIAMADALGIELGTEPKSQVRNCWWVQEEAVVELIAARTAEPIEWQLIFRELLRAKRVGGAFWSWRDPMPFFAYVWRQMKRFGRRLSRLRKG